jgi:predicted DNA-binding WGR domain protein
MKREFYYQDDISNKFWTIELVGNTCITTNGRVGAQPRETRKQFENEQVAKREYEKLIAEKLHKGYVEGAVASAPPYSKPNWAEMAMTEEVFWRLIKLFDWKKTGDDEEVMKPAIVALSKMNIDDIKRFEDILADKLYALDTEAHARETGENAYGTGEYFSVDCFLYDRCCVVANGREYYESVVANPSRMPKDLEFESILYFAKYAYERKTGEEFDYSASTSYETFSNEAGWPDGGIA